MTDYFEQLLAASSFGTEGALALRARGKAQRNEFVLREAAKVLRTYFHPSRTGAVPVPELTANLDAAETLLALAAVRARKDAEPAPLEVWQPRDTAAAELVTTGTGTFSPETASALLDACAATGRVVTAVVSIRHRDGRFWLYWHEPWPDSQ